MSIGKLFTMQHIRLDVNRKLFTLQHLWLSVEQQLFKMRGTVSTCAQFDDGFNSRAVLLRVLVCARYYNDLPVRLMLGLP
eukprot:m.18313 g.18313  ORF g.18313 m.18313 type:complete len:80 (-) comp11948_c0_seq1:214-453(-)